MRMGYIMEANSVDMSSASGPQQHVQAVIEGLIKRGHSVRLLAFQDRRLQWTDDLRTWNFAGDVMNMGGLFCFIEKPVRFMQYHLHLPFFRFFDSVRFSQACRSVFKDFDLLYERDGTMSYGGVIASRRLGIPIIVEVNGDLIDEWRQIGLNFSAPQRAIAHLLTRLTYKYASHIVSVGETLKKKLIQRWRLDPDHITVITNGADVQQFIAVPEDVDVRKKYFLPAGHLIAFSGGFQPWHGVDLILRGFRLALDENPELRLILIGEGPVKVEAEKISAELGLMGRAFFLGKVPHADVASLLHASEILVIYHRAIAADIVETPLKLFEYMASGKAIIAPDVPNMRRILFDGETALLVPQDEPTSLARAIQQLAGDSGLRSHLGKAARADAITKHSWDRVVLDLEKLMEKLIERNDKPDRTAHTPSDFR